MDANPWSYQISAKELVREGEIEPVPNPDTPLVSDQRNYLFAEVDKDTSYPAPPASGTWVGTALAVQLRGGDRWYTSHHDVPDWSIQRDDPAATTVELPPGTASDDITAIKAIAVPVAKTSAPPAPAPADYEIHVRRLNRGFMLDDAWLPQASFLQWAGDVVLTPEQPEAVIWEAAGYSGLRRQLPAGRVDVAAAGQPHRRPHAVLLQRGAERVDRAARGAVVGAGRVVRDQVDLEDARVEQLRELHGLRV